MRIENSKGGFTLIELLVIVAIIGIMLGAAVMSVGSGSASAQMKSATRRVLRRDDPRLGTVLPHDLHGHREQDADDGHHHQQFHEREAGLRLLGDLLDCFSLHCLLLVRAHLAQFL